MFSFLVVLTILSCGTDEELPLGDVAKETQDDQTQDKSPSDQVVSGDAGIEISQTAISVLSLLDHHATAFYVKGRQAQ